jgi:hypothetical protein
MHILVQNEGGMDMMDEEKYPVECCENECEYVKGNLTEVEVKEDDCEIRADVTVKKRETVRIWGQVRYCDGRPVDEALVKLIKVCKHPKPKLVGVAHTVTDCKGFYQFDVCEEEEKKATYFVLAGKAAKGKEKVAYEKECNPCCELHKEE